MSLCHAKYLATKPKSGTMHKNMHIGAHHLNDLLNVFVSGRVGQDRHHLVQKYH